MVQRAGMSISTRGRKRGSCDELPLMRDPRHIVPPISRLASHDISPHCFCPWMGIRSPIQGQTSLEVCSTLMLGKTENQGQVVSAVPLAFF